MQTAWPQQACAESSRMWLWSYLIICVNTWQVVTTHTRKKMLEKIHDFCKNGYNYFLNFKKGEAIIWSYLWEELQVTEKKNNLIIVRLPGLRSANFLHRCRIWTKSKCLKATEVLLFSKYKSNPLQLYALLVANKKWAFFFLFIYWLQLNWGYSGATVLATCCWSTAHSFRCRLERAYQEALCRCTGSASLRQQAGEHSSTETSGPRYTAVIGEHMQSRGFLIQSPQIIVKSIF